MRLKTSHFSIDMCGISPHQPTTTMWHFSYGAQLTNFLDVQIQAIFLKEPREFEYGDCTAWREGGQCRWNSSRTLEWGTIPKG